VIKHQILDGTYEPGERLKEAQLSQALGISRSPIREAIQSLANEGLLRLVPQKGAIVSTFDLEEIRDLYEIRGALDGLAARLAAERATPQQLDELSNFLEATRDTLDSNSSTVYPRDLDFHQQICELAGNRKLLDQASEIRTQLQLARSRVGSKPGRARLGYEEHVAIYEALKDGDPEKAEERMKSHLRNSLNNMVEILSDPESGVA
jgi:DNA-binding GntR family transcriptional regulator